MSTHTITIRPYQPKDLQAVEHICLATTDPMLRATARRREMTLLLYNRYYTRTLAHSFVAVTEADTPIGYILCAPDYTTYKKDFLRVEGKALRRLGPIGAVLAFGEVRAMRNFADTYPAHLHIDILPDYQGQHIGRRLMDTLLAHLKEEQVPGVMLGVSAHNKGGIRFYEACGFRRLQEKSQSIIFAMSL